MVLLTILFCISVLINLYTVYAYKEINSQCETLFKEYVEVLKLSKKINEENAVLCKLIKDKATEIQHNNVSDGHGGSGFSEEIQVIHY